MKHLMLAVAVLIPLCSFTYAGDTPNPDSRLSKKLTYYSGYVRLSDAVDGISKQTGVTIYSGLSSKDWQVRDMPVVVCANDIELGKILNAIAESYYLSLSDTEVGGKKVYRLFRNKERQMVLDNYARARDNASEKYSKAKTEVLLWIGSVSDKESEYVYKEILSSNVSLGSHYGKGSEYERMAFDETRMYGKILSSLSESDLARLYSGEKVTLCASQGGSIGKLLREYTQLRYELETAFRKSHSKEQWSDVSEPDCDEAKMTFSIMPGFSSINSSIIAGQFTAGGHGGDLTSFEMASSKAGSFLPKQQEDPPTALRLLNQIKDNSELETLGTFEFKKPQKDQILLADALEEVSKASGYSILSDDYYDHMTPSPITYEGLFAGRKSLVDVKKTIYSYLFNWRVYTDAKLISLQDTSWVMEYSSLIPRVLFEKWIAKSTGQGLELNDLLDIRRLTDQQKRWIYTTADLKPCSGQSSINYQSFTLDSLAKLSSLQLNTAMRDGIPLASLDTFGFIKLFNSMEETDKPKDEISDMVLTLERTQQPSGKHTYTVRITGENTRIDLPTYTDFPIYSPAREKELTSAQKQ